MCALVSFFFFFFGGLISASNPVLFPSLTLCSSSFLAGQRALDAFFGDSVFHDPMEGGVSLADVFIKNKISKVVFLRGRTVDGWEQFVEKKNGPDGLVRSWLLQEVPGSGGRKLRDFCEGATVEKVRMDGIRSPSNISSETAEKSFSQVPVSISEDLLFLSKKMYDISEKDGVSDVGGAVVRELCYCQRLEEGGTGFYGDRGIKDVEMSYSSVCTNWLSKMCRVVGGFDASWYHQIVDHMGAIVDILLTAHAEPDVAVQRPVLVIECGVNGSARSKMNQGLAYMNNVFPQANENSVLLVCELIIKEPFRRSTMAVSACFFRDCGQGGKMGHVLLWEGKATGQAFDALLHACDVVAGRNYGSFGWKPFRKMVNKNVVLEDGRVFKSYDYRCRKVGKDDRRSYELMVELVPGCEKVHEVPNCVVISYPFIVGSGSPSSPSHLIALIDGVLVLHESGIVHGDIRVSNIVFGLNGVATLIDFDFSGKDGVKKYPSTFNTRINDGARHPDVAGGVVLKFKHDWFAVAELVSRCKLGDGREKKIAALLKKKEPECENAKSELRSCTTLDYDAKVRTGSPPKKDVSPRSSRTSASSSSGTSASSSSGTSASNISGN